MPWPRYPDKWVIKTWYNNTMEPHWVVKKNEIMKYVGKWNPESVILSKVTQTQKDKNHINFSHVDPTFYWMCISACELRYRPGSREGGDGRGKRHWGRGRADGWFMLHAHCPWSSSIRNIDLKTRSRIHVASLVSGGVSGLGVFFAISQVLFRLRGLEPPYKTGSLHHDRSFSLWLLF